MMVSSATLPPKEYVMLSFPTLALPRRIASDTGSKLIIPISRHKKWLHFSILIYWLMAWTFGELAAVNELNRQNSAKGDAFFLAWMILWTLGGSIALFDLFWQVWGRQTLAVERSYLTHRRGLLGLSWVKRYDLNRVDNIRVFSSPETGGHGRTLAFDYDNKTIRLSANMDGIEAKQIAHIIQKYTQTCSYPMLQTS
jgi:hypothetical protein